MRWIARPVWAGIAVLCMPQVVLSQQQRSVEEVLVVGARLPRPLADVVGTVDVLTRALLVENLTVSLSDTVRYTPGVSVVSADARFANGEYTIRGLSGNRVLSLIDGVPVSKQFDIGAFSNAGQDYLIPDAVSRIEIMRGPASTLFGSDALGGVVATLTRDPEEFLRGQDAAVGGSGTYGGADESFTWTGFAAGRAGDLSGVVHGSWLEGNEQDHSAGGSDDEIDRTRKAVMTKVAYVLPSGNSLRLRMDAFKENVDSDLEAVLGYGRRYRNTTLLQGDDQRTRYALGLGYEFRSAQPWLEYGLLNVYGQRTKVDQRTHELREAATPPVEINRQFEYDVDDFGVVADFESVFSAGRVDHRVGWGARIQYSELEERRDGRQIDLLTGDVTNVLIGEVMPVRDFPNSDVTEMGIYLHDEIRFGAVTLIPGLRFEHYDMEADADLTFRGDNPDTHVENVSDSEWVPKLGLMWRISETTTGFAHYAHGFRAPSFEDVNIGLDIALFNYRGIPNPDLRSETSDGLELGLRYVGDVLQASTSLFGAHYDDFIETRAIVGIDPDTGTLLFQSRNIDRARVYGAEFSVRVLLDAIVRGLALDSAANWTVGENRKTNEPLNTVDPPELVTTLSWQANSRVRLAAIGTFVAKQDEVDDSRMDLFKPDGFALLDLTASYRFTPDVWVNAGLFNVFDKTHWRWSTVRARPDDDPLIDTLSAPGRYASVSVHVSL